MEREKINKVLGLDRLQWQINNLSAVLDYNTPYANHNHEQYRRKQKF